jgi:hypothetical protein
MSGHGLTVCILILHRETQREFTFLDLCTSTERHKFSFVELFVLQESKWQQPRRLTPRFACDNGAKDVTVTWLNPPKTAEILIIIPLFTNAVRRIGVPPYTSPDSRANTEF